jgi:hypothetical protein
MGHQTLVQLAGEHRDAAPTGMVAKRAIVVAASVGGDRITPFALNIAMAGASDAPKREQLGRAAYAPWACCRRLSPWPGP